jgi:hypothetical protein
MIHEWISRAICCLVLASLLTAARPVTGRTYRLPDSYPIEAFSISITSFGPAIGQGSRLRVSGDGTVEWSDSTESEAPVARAASLSTDEVFAILERLYRIDFFEMPASFPARVVPSLSDGTVVAVPPVGPSVNAGRLLVEVRIGEFRHRVGGAGVPADVTELVAFVDDTVLDAAGWDPRPGTAAPQFDVPPRIRSWELPAFPDSLLPVDDANVVMVELSIDTRGRVDGARLLRSRVPLPPDLERLVLAAAREVEFEPAIRRIEQAVPARRVLPIRIPARRGAPARDGNAPSR